MPSLKPVNDYFMVEIERNPQGFVDTLDVNQEGIMEGRVISISDEMTFFGFNSFMFDKSLMDKELLKQLHDHYAQYVGKKVYWPLRTETGSVIKVEGSQYVFLKMTAIMAVEDN